MLLYKNRNMTLELYMRDLQNAVFRRPSVSGDGYEYIFAYGVSWDEGKQEVEWQNGTYGLTEYHARKMFKRFLY